MLLPVKPTGNHQVKDQPVVVRDADGKALADAAQILHRFPLHSFEWGERRAQQKGACQANPFEFLSQNPLLESLQVHRDVRQLGHGLHILSFRLSGRKSAP